MRGFSVIWLGQIVSMVGSSMTGFAIIIWAWQETGQATALALVAFFSMTPAVLLSPLAGALIDRWSRKLVLILSDLGACLSTVVMLILHLNGGLAIWHLYLLGAFGGAFGAFQDPAYAATIGTMVPKHRFARANAMLSLANSASSVAAPALAGLLLVIIGIDGIFTLDIVTFLIAFGTLLRVRIPRPPVSEDGQHARGDLRREVLYGFAYIRRRAGLRTLLLLFTAINVIGALGMVMIAPMILARSGGDELALGAVLSALGAGGIVGGILMSLWGGPRRRIHGVLLGMIAVCAVGYGLLGWGSSLLVWTVGAFAITFFLPLMSACNQAIWQSKVASDVQGKVFAARQFVGKSAMPLVMLLAGPLADRVFEPAMLPGGALAGSVGAWLGTGQGMGMALMFLVAGALGTLLATTAYLVPSVRRVEEELPDFDAAAREGAAQDETALNETAMDAAVQRTRRG